MNQEEGESLPVLFLKDGEPWCVRYIERSKRQVAAELARAVGGYEHVTDAMLERVGLERADFNRCAMDYYDERRELADRITFDELIGSAFT